MSDTDLCYMGAAEAVALFKARKLSPVELMQAVIARAEAVEPKVNCFADTYYDEAMELARKAEARYARPGARLRPLEGVPVAIKDENRIKGKWTSSGSLTTPKVPDSYTSYSVERLMKAGGIVHARSTAPEFACAGITHSKLWGVSRNPWNTDFTTGGSSGGAGGSLAAGTTTLANGSDIWGSIRMPASCCGVLGFKPPYGRVPEDPPFNLDYYCHEGPMARSVADLRLMQNVMAGPHPLDITTVRPKLSIPAELKPIKGWKIAFSMDLGYFEVDPEVVRNTRALLDRLRDLGAEVEEVDLGWTEETLTAASNYLGHIFGNMIGGLLPRHREQMTNYARSFAEFGQRTTATDLLTSMEVLNDMYATLGPLLERYNAFICPTMPLPAVRADYDPGTDRCEINGREVHPVWGWTMTYPFNMMSRCPVMSVPSGFAGNGVPTGVQIVGRTYDDVSVFRVAADLERVQPLYGEEGARPKL
ncbi:amidase [Roseovarius faecimaris]|uniref:Amidase n=1 Tax=Roseovarius faecimaris TaxID=2494550 RepID=A0A6I6INL1_9RHOB|nr:amidase [Roseovarius faecimaris]QGX97403.1 amidase [Roseovarius faecimaris]